jgi:soluble cytochrome b562
VSDTPQTIMPLEETQDFLTHLRNEAVRERDVNAKKRDKALSSLEKALYNEGFAGWDEHVRVLDSALHHLEAGKKAQLIDGIQVLPSLEKRAESGALRFGDDWPGVFFRGDDAGYSAMVLGQFIELMRGKDGIHPIMLAQVEGVQRKLASCVIGPAAQHVALSTPTEEVQG